MIEAIALFGWTFIITMIIIVLKASDTNNKESHHDGRVGSFYEISNRRDK